MTLFNILANIFAVLVFVFPIGFFGAVWLMEYLMNRAASSANKNYGNTK